MSVPNNKVDQYTHGEQDWVMQEPDSWVIVVHGLILPEEPREVTMTEFELGAFDWITEVLLVPVTA